MRHGKILTATVILLLVFSATLTAQSRSDRLGLAFGIPNGALVYRPAPFDLKFGYDFTEGQEFIFVSGDLRLIDNRQIVGVLHGSLGIGLYGKLYPSGRDDDGSIDFDGGTRIPIAASVLLFRDFLEFFVEVAPGIDFYPRAQLADQPIQVVGGATIQLD